MSAVDRPLSVLLELIVACEVIIFITLIIFGVLFVERKFLILISLQTLKNVL